MSLKSVVLNVLNTEAPFRPALHLLGHGYAVANFKAQSVRPDGERIGCVSRSFSTQIPMERTAASAVFHGVVNTMPSRQALRVVGGWVPDTEKLLFGPL